MTGTRRSNSPYSFFLTAVNTRSPSACGSGLAFAAIGAKVLAGGTEHIAHRAAAVVNAVDDRLGKRHEPPHEVERQVGARLGDPVGDHRPRKIQVADEVGAFLPIDEGVGRPECRDPLADLGGDDLAPGLAGQFETQSALDSRLLPRELHKYAGQALGAKPNQVLGRDRLLRSGSGVCTWKRMP
jgi:hypothetical protein